MRCCGVGVAHSMREDLQQMQRVGLIWIRAHSVTADSLGVAHVFRFILLGGAVERV
jgi:hypothetical protein